VDLAALIRDVPDFPKAGIVFKDITPLLAEPEAVRYAADELAKRFADAKPDVVVAAEARGFLFGPPVAMRLGAAFAPARKPGKLPWRTRTVTYTLEYGEDAIALHEDALAKGRRVLIIDDLLATGGTVAAMAKLVAELGGEVVGAGFVVELDFLEGRERLAPVRVESLVHYGTE